MQFITKAVLKWIRDMWRFNPTWGALWIVSKLHKLGIEVANSTEVSCASPEASSLT